MVMAFPFGEVALRPSPTGYFSRTRSLPGARSNRERDEGLALALRPGFSSGSWPKNSAQENRGLLPVTRPTGVLVAASPVVVESTTIGSGLASGSRAWEKTTSTNSASSCSPLTTCRNRDSTKPSPSRP